jgi:cytochrome c-type biogenesis protein CcmH/NrfG
VAEDMQQQILEELRKQTALFSKTNKTSIIALSVFLVVIVLLMVLTPFIQRISSRPNTCLQPADSWREARSLSDGGDLGKAEEMTQRLIKKYPNYWHGYALLGSFHQQLGEFKEAEKAYSRAYDLFPSEDNKKVLDAIQTVLRRNATANK